MKNSKNDVTLENIGKLIDQKLGRKLDEKLTPINGELKSLNTKVVGIYGELDSLKQQMVESDAKMEKGFNNVIDIVQDVIGAVEESCEKRVSKLRTEIETKIQHVCPT